MQDLAASRAEMRAKIDAGQDSIAIVRAMYDDDRPGTFASFPEWRRQTLIDNARTTAPLLANSLLSESSGAPEVVAVVVADFLAREERPCRGPRPDGAFTVSCLDRFPRGSRLCGRGARQMVLSRSHFAWGWRAALLAGFEILAPGNGPSARPRALGEGRISRAKVNP